MHNFPLKKRRPSPSSPSSISNNNTPITVSINGYYQNHRGLRTKLVNFNYNTSCLNYVFIAFTKTWLTNSFHNSEVGLSNYNVFRCDSSSQTSSFNRGGGVLVAVRKDVAFSRLISPNYSVEQLFVLFSHNFLNINVCIRASSFLKLNTTYLDAIDHIF
jgi:hypothetical protein